jgi:hypothetical protein
MMALQKSLMEQSDITETLKSSIWYWMPSKSELEVMNPPVVEFKPRRCLGTHIRCRSCEAIFQAYSFN